MHVVANKFSSKMCILVIVCVKPNRPLLFTCFDGHRKCGWFVNEYLIIAKMVVLNCDLWDAHCKHYQGSPLRPWPQKMTVFSGEWWHLPPPPPPSPPFSKKQHFYGCQRHDCLHPITVFQHIQNIGLVRTHMAVSTRYNCSAGLAPD